MLVGIWREMMVCTADSVIVFYRRITRRDKVMFAAISVIVCYRELDGGKW